MGHDLEAISCLTFVKACDDGPVRDHHGHLDLDDGDFKTVHIRALHLSELWVELGTQGDRVYAPLFPQFFGHSLALDLGYREDVAVLTFSLLGDEALGRILDHCCVSVEFGPVAFCLSQELLMDLFASTACCLNHFCEKYVLK